LGCREVADGAEREWHAREPHDLTLEQAMALRDALNHIVSATAMPKTAEPAHD
jgi:hypothetical protein